MFKPYFKHPRIRFHASSASYTPKQLASLYSFPPGATGAGKKCAVIELGGDFSQSDLDTYFKSLGLSVKPVVPHLIAGAKRVSDPNGADGEVMLDLCVIGGMAPGVELHCYFSPNTDAGFLAAIEQAIADKMDAISISWGAPENQWTTATVAGFNKAFQAAIAAGITVTAAAGDNGSGDGESGQHVDFPASSPYVTGCGGTSIKTASPLSEVVWNDGTQGGATGGGVSADFAAPSYQLSAPTPSPKFRCVPDIAGNADPESGWLVIVNGAQEVIGGTSAVAPMIAALACCLGEALGKNVGFLNPALYSLAGWARDITSGNNGTYVAKSGYDCCTGTGVPIGAKLLAALAGPVVAPPVPVPPPVVTPPAPPAVITHTLTIVGAGSVLFDGKQVA